MYYFLLVKVTAWLNHAERWGIHHMRYGEYKLGVYRPEQPIQFVLLLSLLTPPLVAILVCDLLNVSFNLTLIVLAVVVADMFIGSIIAAVQHVKAKRATKP